MAMDVKIGPEARVDLYLDMLHRRMAQVDARLCAHAREGVIGEEAAAALIAEVGSIRNSLENCGFLINGLVAPEDQERHTWVERLFQRVVRYSLQEEWQGALERMYQGEEQEDEVDPHRAKRPRAD